MVYIRTRGTLEASKQNPDENPNASLSISAGAFEAVEDGLVEAHELATREPLAVTLHPMSLTPYPASDLTVVVDTDAPSYSGIQYLPWSTTARLSTPGGILTTAPDPSGFGANQINGATSGMSLTGFSVESIVKGTDATFHVHSYGAGDYKLYVDDMPVTMSWQHFPATATGYFIKLTFATSRVRKIRLHTGFTPFAQILIPGDGDAWAAPKRFSVAVISDSFFHGTGDTTEGAIFAGSLHGELAERTGWGIFNLAQGGTGYLNVGDGTTTGTGGFGPNGVSAFGSADRLAALAALPELDLIVVSGGANDGSFPPANAAAAATALYGSLATTRPETPVVVVGIQSGIYPSIDAALDALNGAVKGAALAAPNVRGYIDMRTPQQWVAGTGRVGNRVGDGNADIFRSSDDVHPSHAGFAYIADLIVKQLATIAI